VAVVLVVPRVVWSSNLADIRASALYVVNWRLAIQNTNYLHADDTPSLVQHFWSLSLEEQFYLAWPLLLVVVAWAGARHLTIGRRGAVVTTLAVTWVVSFACCVVTTASQPSTTFFMPQARAWEFALGGLVAVGPRLTSLVAARAALLVGVGLVVGCCFALDTTTEFPGWRALVPTIGVAMAIVGGSYGSPRWLGVRPVTWLGDHSYSVYLWHWPPIVVLPWVVHGEPGNSARIGVLVATLALAWATKRYVEDPVRRSAWSLRRIPALGLASVGALTLAMAAGSLLQYGDGINDHQEALMLASFEGGRPCFGAAAIVTESCPDPYRRPDTEVVDFAAADHSPVPSSCQLSPDAGPEPTFCAFGDLSHPTSVIALVGSSYAVQLVPMLVEWTRGHHVQILLAARTDCLGVATVGPPTPVPGPCAGWASKVRSSLLRVQSLSVVLFASHEQSAAYLTGEQEPDRLVARRARQDILETLGSYQRAGVPTIVVKHAPTIDHASAPECIALSEDADDPCSRPRGPSTHVDFLSSVAWHHPRTTAFLSMDRLFCDDERCHETIGGVVAYCDDHHISAMYARTLAPYLGPRIDRVISSGRRRSSTDS
jgi:peptidoglycan/LPS O-acetylase OafA/YrhL